MATKRLARTVIEGGRDRYNKHERHHSNRSQRRKERIYTHRLRLSPEEAEAEPAPRRSRVMRYHYDRLGPALCWLASFEGQRWDDVRSEIARRFDTRTIAGQHIVFDHLLPLVIDSDYRYFRPRFYVDQSGRLRAPGRRGRYRRRQPAPT